MKKISSLIILVIAVGLGIYLIIEDKEDRTNENREAIDQYLAQDGIENRIDLQEESSLENGNLNEIGLAPGMLAKPFELEALNGATYNLEEFKGDYVVINMWATWCAPCRDEMPDFSDFYTKYNQDNLQFLAINMTNTESNKEGVLQFVEDFEIPFPVLMDPGGIVEKEYEVFAMPTTYILDPDGRIQMKRLGEINFDYLEEQYLNIKDKYENPEE